MFGANMCVSNKSSQDVQYGAMLNIKYLTDQASTTEWAQKTSYMPVRPSAFTTLQVGSTPRTRHREWVPEC